jgi:hypothetical protein
VTAKDLAGLHELSTPLHPRLDLSIVVLNSRPINGDYVYNPAGKISTSRASFGCPTRDCDENLDGNGVRHNNERSMEDSDHHHIPSPLRSLSLLDHATNTTNADTRKIDISNSSDAILLLPQLVAMHEDELKHIRTVLFDPVWLPAIPFAESERFIKRTWTPRQV